MQFQPFRMKNHDDRAARKSRFSSITPRNCLGYQKGTLNRYRKNLKTLALQNFMLYTTATLSSTSVESLWRTRGLENFVSLKIAKNHKFWLGHHGNGWTQHHEILQAGTA